MNGIEKNLKDYINKKGPMIKKSELDFWAKRDPNNVINTIFTAISEELENITGLERLDRFENVLKLVYTIIHNYENVNRKITQRKIKKLYNKIEILKDEKKKKFKNPKQAIYELDKFQKLLENLDVELEEKDTKQYEAISYLVDKIRNLSYIDFIFKNMPHLITAKDKQQKSLFYNLVLKYIDAVQADEDESILYYSNLISFILSKKDIDTDVIAQEKKDAITKLNEEINKLSIEKKKAKKNKNKIENLITLSNAIKGAEDKDNKRIDILANKYNIKVVYNPELIETAKLAKEKKEGQITDREEVEDYIVTIDPNGTKEIDDGLSCKKLPNGNYLLGVHVVSILGYFSYDSEIVKEALDRCRAIYLPTPYKNSSNDLCRLITMFPSEFSVDIASLTPGEKKLARSYFFEINANGEIVNERFVKTIIKSNKKTTYDEFNSILENGSDDEQLNETAKNLQEAITLIEPKYLPTKLYEQLKEYNEECPDASFKKTRAGKIVYQATLLTGNRVATFFAKNNYPMLYRVHEVNQEDVNKISSLIEDLSNAYGGSPKLFQIVDGLYPKGWYATSGRHAGLNIDHYCHCTSGLRRAADIVVEHGLEICYDKEPSEEELKELAAEIKYREETFSQQESLIQWFLKDYAHTYKKYRRK